MTQEAVAEAGDLRREEIAKIEGGKNAATTARIQKGLADAYGVRPEDVDEYLAGELSLEALLQRRAGHVSDVVSAVLAMARASGFEDDFLKAWTPTPAEGRLMAESVWTLCRADYLRWHLSAGVPERSN